MDDCEIRLRLLEVLIPQATRVAIIEPEYILKTCRILENYVIGSQQLEKGDEPESPPDFLRDQPKRRTGRPKKSD
jgi:hypothetical protein